MTNNASYVRKTCMSAIAVCALVSMPAFAGGNGNGGNGSGGAHGAATSGMTYHSEPVSSPWNRVPGNLSKNMDRSHEAPDQTMSENANMPQTVAK